YSISFAALDSKSPTNLHKFDVYREKRKNLITKFWIADEGNGRQFGFNTGRYKTIPTPDVFKFTNLIALKKDQLDLYSPEKYIRYKTPSKPSVQEYKQIFGFPPDNIQKFSEFRYYDSISSGFPAALNPNSYKRLSLGSSTGPALSPIVADYAYAVNSDSTTGFSGIGSVQGNVATISVVNSGCLTAGQTLVGKGIIVGTKVIKINSGSGKEGTYIIDNYHDVSTENNIEITGWVFTNQMVNDKQPSEIYFNASSSPFSTLDDVSYKNSQINFQIRGKIDYLYNKITVGAMTRSKFYGSDYVANSGESIVLEVSNAVHLIDSINMQSLPNQSGTNLLFAINIINPLWKYDNTVNFSPDELSPAIYINGFLQPRYTYNDYCESVKQTILEIIKNKYSNTENMTEAKINEIATWIAVQSNISQTFTDKLDWGTELRIPSII
ncbi:MAG: hypothetical protein EBS34_09845, partial [Flavobacteriales bacterium]|nr:hypothetical protein [Flavobacteriales bacterium]